MTPVYMNYEQAYQKLIKLKNFYNHSLAYVLVNTALFILNLHNLPQQFWFHYILLAWGLGLAALGLSSFEIFHLFSRNRQEEVRLAVSNPMLNINQL